MTEKNYFQEGKLGMSIKILGFSIEIIGFWIKILEFSKKMLQTAPMHSSHNAGTVMKLKAETVHVFNMIAFMGKVSVVLGVVFHLAFGKTFYS